jgi:superfamily II DNA or RNA helicase
MRNFTNKQRDAIRVADGNVCQSCGALLNKSNYHADHVHAYANGGQTVIENGQALCASCNLAKSDKPYIPKQRKGLPKLPSEPLIPLYKWQLQFRDAVEQSLDAINANVTVGAGKTFATLSAYQSVLAKRFARPLLIVAAPRINLLDGWQESALEKCGLSLKIGSDIDTIPDIEAGYIHGLLFTYQAIAQNPDRIASLCNRFDVVMVRDECQWISESNTWGATFADCTSKAKFHIGLTGTPFRSAENEKLWGFKYSEDKVVTDFTYDYLDGLRDGINPKLNWSSLGGSIAWQDETPDGIRSKSESRFGEDEQTDQTGKYAELELMNKRLRAATYASERLLSSFLVEMIEQADAELSEIRKTHVDAGGVISAQSQKAAKRIVQMLRSRGRLCELVVSDDSGHKENLRAFKNSDSEWLVSVDMLKEGTDIPRLRVAVLASCTVTSRQVIQMVGRILRVYQGISAQAQPVMVYLPMDPRLVKIMSNFGDGCDIKRKTSSGSEGGGSGGDGVTHSVLVAIDSEGVAIELSGTVGEVKAEATSGESIRHLEVFRKAWGDSDMGLPYDSVTMAQVFALQEITAQMYENLDTIASLAMGDYVHNRNAMAGKLAARTGLNREGCKRLMDVIIRSLLQKRFRHSFLGIGMDG